MPMRALPTLSLLGALNTVPSPTPINTNTQALPHFVEMLAQAGVPAQPVKASLAPAEATTPAIAPEQPKTTPAAFTNTPQIKSSLPSQPAEPLATTRTELTGNETVPGDLPAQSVSLAKDPVSIPSAPQPKDVSVERKPEEVTPSAAPPIATEAKLPPRMEDVPPQPATAVARKPATEIGAAKPTKEEKLHKAAPAQQTQVVAQAISDVPVINASPLPVQPALLAASMPSSKDAPSSTTPTIATKPAASGIPTASNVAPVPGGVPTPAATPAKAAVQTEIAPTEAETVAQPTPTEAQAAPQPQAIPPTALGFLQPIQAVSQQPSPQAATVLRASPKQNPIAPGASAPKRTTEAQLSSPAATATPATPAPIATPQQPVASTHPLASELAATPIQPIPQTAIPTTHASATPQPAASVSEPAHTQPALHNPDPTPSHTTLTATPTVLEVGVPGGSHGWLRIRAEIGEGGTVQASLTAATPAGHETLHRDLPAMNAFLSNEQLAVQLHVIEPTAPTTDHGFTQSASTGQQGTGSQREAPYQPPTQTSTADTPDAAWSGAEYGALPGGSWVNVVA